MPDAAATGSDKEIETPDRSRDDDFEGVSPADQKKLKGSLVKTTKRGRRKGHKLKRKRSILKAASLKDTEPDEEEEEKFELPKLPKKPRTTKSGDGPEPEEFRELPSTTRAREAREAKAKAKAVAKAKAKAKGKPGRPRRDETIPDGPVTFLTDENGLVMGCSSCRFSWWGCATCKNPSFKGKRRNQVTWADIFKAKQTPKGSTPVKKATAKGKPKASAKTAAKASPKAKAKGKAKAKATAKAKGKAKAVAKSSSSKSKKAKDAEWEDETEGDDGEED